MLTFPVPPDHEKLSGVYTPSFNPVPLFTFAVDLFRSDSYFDSLSGFPLLVVLFPAFPELFPLEVFPGLLLFPPGVSDPLLPLLPFEAPPLLLSAILVIPSEWNVSVLVSHLLLFVV